MSALQTRRLPSTKSRAFHRKKKTDKENSCFLQNQYPHMWKHQKKNMLLFLGGKSLQDDSVEICVRVDSVEIYFLSLVL